MGASLIPYDSAKDGEWTAFVSKNNLLVFNNMVKENAIALDTVSTTELISGLTFTRMDIVIKMQKTIILKVIDLNRQFANHALRISLSFTEQEDAEKFLNILRKSTFAEVHGK